MIQIIDVTTDRTGRFDGTTDGKHTYEMFLGERHVASFTAEGTAGLSQVLAAAWCAAMDERLCAIEEALRGIEREAEARR